MISFRINHEITKRLMIFSSKLIKKGNINKCFGFEQSQNYFEVRYLNILPSINSTSSFEFSLRLYPIRRS